MAQPFDRLIKELQVLMSNLNSNNTDLLGVLKSATLIGNDNKPLKKTPGQNPANLSKELQDILAAFISQYDYTASTLTVLNSLQPPSVIETLRTATNLIQIYFQVTQPFEQILSNLIDNLLPDSALSGNITSANIQSNIQIINTDRQNLQKIQNKALQEFGSVLKELDLQKLVQTSNVIFTELKNSPNLDVLSTAIDRLISHLTSAQEFFQTFGENDGNITGNEANEIQQLIKNWSESVSKIETIEKTNPTIQSDLGIPINSRLAIAQSIKIHDLLETNYDYLTALVRSIDLVSAGSL
jgi:hypothetical protein